MAALLQKTQSELEQLQSKVGMHAVCTKARDVRETVKESLKYDQCSVTRQTFSLDVVRKGTHVMYIDKFKEIYIKYLKKRFKKKCIQS